MISPDVSEAIRRKYECEDHRFEPRQKFDKLGRPFWVEQCLNCWEQGKTLKKESIPPSDLACPVLFDDEARKNRNDARAQEFQNAWAEARERENMEQEQARAQYTQRYHEYLETPQWKAKSAAVIRRANGVCEGCLDARATEAHHTTYEHIFNEPLFDLVALCRPCHARIHSEKSGAA